MVAVIASMQKRSQIREEMRSIEEDQRTIPNPGIILRRSFCIKIMKMLVDQRFINAREHAAKPRDA